MDSETASSSCDPPRVRQNIYWSLSVCTDAKREGAREREREREEAGDRGEGRGKREEGRGKRKEERGKRERAGGQRDAHSHARTRA